MATTGKTVAKLRLLHQAKTLSCSKLKKDELIQLLLDNESVDVVAADDSSGDGADEALTKVTKLLKMMVTMTK